MPVVEPETRGGHEDGPIGGVCGEGCGGEEEEGGKEHGEEIHRDGGGGGYDGRGLQEERNLMGPVGKASGHSGSHFDAAQGIR